MSPAMFTPESLPTSSEDAGARWDVLSFQLRELYGEAGTVRAQQLFEQDLADKSLARKKEAAGRAALMSASAAKVRSKANEIVEMETQRKFDREMKDEQSKRASRALSHCIW